MAETKKSEPKLWQKKWFPWALAGVLLLVVGLAGWSSLSARTRQKELEAELQLQRETIEALRAQAGQEEDEGLIHEALPVITDSLISQQLTAPR